MNIPDIANAALTEQQALEAEFDYLHVQAAADSHTPGSLDERRRELRRKIHALGDDQAPWALCLSGGGIRSATFALGVLQGLAKGSLLKRFTYLSTVSGGGYIGSWLSRWIREAGDIDNVQSDLKNGTPGAVAGEPSQVSRLRAFSNYLSPVWGFSSDFFTLVSIVLRNLLLNWCVLLPLLAAAVLPPYLYFQLLFWKVGTEGAVIAGVLTALALVVGIAYVVTDLPKGQRPGTPPRDRFVRYCFIPVLLAAVALSLALRWLEADLSTDSLRWAAILGIAVHLSGNVFGRAWRKRRLGRSPLVTEKAPWWRMPLGGLLLIVSGAAGGVLVYYLFAFARWSTATGDLGLLYATLCVPALLLAFWLATTAYVALARRWSAEGEREWWARSGGWWIRASLLWAGGFALVVYVPQWLLQIPGVAALDTKTLVAGGGLSGLVGLATGLVGYWSKNGSAITRRARGFAEVIGARLLDLAAVAFILALLVAYCFLLSRLLAAGHPGFTAAEYVRRIVEVGPAVWGLFVALLVVGWGFSVCVGVNTFSLHSMYGNRLARAYLGAARPLGSRHPHWYTGFDDDDNVSLRQLQRDQAPVEQRRLFQVLNLTLNLTAAANDRLEWQQRKAASFSVTPLHCGSAVVGYLPSAQYAGPVNVGISLARAMAISGAAASPNMGYHSSVAVAFVMTLFNVRLGWWLPNPGSAGRGVWQRGEPGMSSLRLLVDEALGRAKSDQSYVYLSDGGHFENLGLYEMVKRRCRRILVVDASADPGYGYQDLQDAIRKIRVDFGIAIDFPQGSFATPRRYTVGTIRYRDTDPDARQDGVLCYLKPALFGDEPLDVQRYAAASRQHEPKDAFPHQSTADQFFDEAQFESYRMLGAHMVAQMLAASGEGLLPEQSAPAEAVP